MSCYQKVCREAVVRVSHERAMELELGDKTAFEKNNIDSDENTKHYQEEGDDSILRPVSENDFILAISKLKASVDDSGREIQKVVEWNEKYGEMKR